MIEYTKQFGLSYEKLFTGLVCLVKGRGYHDGNLDSNKIYEWFGVKKSNSTKKDLLKKFHDRLLHEHRFINSSIVKSHYCKSDSEFDKISKEYQLECNRINKSKGLTPINRNSGVDIRSISHEDNRKYVLSKLHPTISTVIDIHQTALNRLNRSKFEHGDDYFYPHSFAFDDDDEVKSIRFAMETGGHKSANKHNRDKIELIYNGHIYYNPRSNKLETISGEKATHSDFIQNVHDISQHHIRSIDNEFTNNSEGDRLSKASPEGKNLLKLRDYHQYIVDKTKKLL